MTASEIAARIMEIDAELRAKPKLVNDLLDERHELQTWIDMYWRMVMARA